jgi:ribosomal protein S18 acetylase RimI-like enzyme
VHGDRQPGASEGDAPSVRAAREADAPAIAGIARRAATEVYEGTVEDRAIIENVRSDGYVDGLREHLRTLPDRDGYCYLVAGIPTVADSDSVQGFAQFVWAPMDTDPFVGRGECLLHSLYVDPDHWSEGLGTALVDAGRERLPPDLTALRLAVLEGNDDGVAFYEAYGFERTGEAVVDVAGGEYPSYVYSLSLD